MVVQKIDEVLDRSRAPANVVVYRGVYDDAAGPLKSAVAGAVYRDPGFFSSTLSKAIAKNTFSNRGGVVIELVVPRGARALYMDELLAHMGREVEFFCPAIVNLKC